MQSLRTSLSTFRTLCTSIYKSPGPIPTRPRQSQRPAPTPYELPNEPRPTYPKRRSPLRRSTALIQALQQEEQLRMLKSGKALFPQHVPNPRSGDIIRVGYKQDGRHLYFTGICMAVRKRGVGSTVVLRNVVDGVAVERGFPFWSPNIVHAQVLGKKKVRRNKLYYLREKPLKESFVQDALKRPQS